MIFKTGFKAKATLVAIFAVAAIFAACSNPSSSSGDANASSAYVPRGSVIKGMYSGENGGTQVVFDVDGTVEFRDNGGASARAVSLSNGNLCARGTYVVTANNIAQITIMEVLNDWGDISKNELDSYKDKEFAIKVAFSGNNLYITVDEKPLSFSTDKKDVYEPSSVPLFSNGRPVNATYLLRQTLTLNGGNFSFTVNITFDSAEWTCQGKYTQSDNTIEFNAPTLIGGEDAKKATATISGNTMTLIIEYDEGSDIDKTVFKKGTSDKEWEHSEKLTLFSNGDVKYYENNELCWEGSYTIIDAETASVIVKSGSIKDIFGTDQGNLYIADASQKFLDLDLHDLDDRGGIAIPFAREK